MNEGYAPGLYPIRIGTLSILDAALAGRTPAPVAKSVNGVGEEASEPSGLTPKQRKVWDWLRTHDADVTHDLPSARTVADASGVSKSVVSPVLKLYRHWTKKDERTGA